MSFAGWYELHEKRKVSESCGFERGLKGLALLVEKACCR
jgi:hypothetical protein